MAPPVSQRQAGAVSLFRNLHQAGCFLLPNPWDPGTAVYLERLGFSALATTSAGFAFSRAKPDGISGVPMTEMLAHIREMVQATSLPVNADFQSGYADEPLKVAANTLRCVETGVAGLSIEDNSGRSERPLYDQQLAVERIQAARQAIDDSGAAVLLTARCEAWLVDQPNPFRTSLDRLVAYAEAGADCLYAPGVSQPNEIKDLVAAIAPRPLNVLVSAFNRQLTVAELAELGVRRISVGSGFAAVAWGAFMRSARDIMTNGRFDTFAESASFAEINELF